MFATLLLSALLGQATGEYNVETDAEGNTVYRAKVTEIDMEEVELEASMVKPTGVLSVERPGFVASSFIELRTDFNDEMEHSIDAVK